MRMVLVILLTVHGLVHGMGFAKAFGVASLPQLTQPISRGMGILWLVAGMLILASAAMLMTSPRSWWIVGTVALLASQAVIVSA